MASNLALTPMIVRKITKKKTSTVTSMNDIKDTILVEKLPKPKLTISCIISISEIPHCAKENAIKMKIVVV